MEICLRHAVYWSSITALIFTTDFVFCYAIGGTKGCCKLYGKKTLPLEQPSCDKQVKSLNGNQTGVRDGVDIVFGENLIDDLIRLIGTLSRDLNTGVGTLNGSLGVGLDGVSGSVGGSHQTETSSLTVKVNEGVSENSRSASMSFQTKSGNLEGRYYKHSNGQCTDVSGYVSNGDGNLSGKGTICQNHVSGQVSGTAKTEIGEINSVVNGGPNGPSFSCNVNRNISIGTLSFDVNAKGNSLGFGSSLSNKLGDIQGQIEIDPNGVSSSVSTTLNSGPDSLHVNINSNHGDLSLAAGVRHETESVTLNADFNVGSREVSAVFSASKNIGNSNVNGNLYYGTTRGFTFGLGFNIGGNLDGPRCLFC